MTRRTAALAVLSLILVAGLETPRQRPDAALQAVSVPAVPHGAQEPILSVPANHGAVGSALIGGYATWYDTPGLTAAAGPLLREALGDWRGQLIEVESGPRSVTVRLTDWCACGVRHGTPTIIDLSRSAFAELAEPRLGIVRVSIEIDPAPHPDDDRMRAEDNPAPTLPATDR